MKTLLLIFILFLPQLKAEESAPPPATLSEIGRLEKMFSRRPLFSEERDVLTGLYFLNGECEKIIETFQDKRQPEVALSLRDQDILCACNGRCDFIKLSQKSRFQQKLAAFKSLLKLNHKLTGEGELAQLWNQIKDFPQAQMAAYKVLVKSDQKEDQVLARKIFERLNVK